MFGVLHRPAPDGVSRAAGWVFCGPFGQERGLTHRLMVEWARVLCGEGYPVLRFDYRGYGESDGLFDEVTIEDHVADTGLRPSTNCAHAPGSSVTGLCGLRLGANGGRLWRRRAMPMTIPSMLWHPVVRGEGYVGRACSGNTSRAK